MGCFVYILFIFVFISLQIIIIMRVVEIIVLAIGRSCTMHTSHIHICATLFIRWMLSSAELSILRYSQTVERGNESQFLWLYYCYIIDNDWIMAI